MPSPSNTARVVRLLGTVALGLAGAWLLLRPWLAAPTTPAAPARKAFAPLPPPLTSGEREAAWLPRTALPPEPPTLLWWEAEAPLASNFPAGREFEPTNDLERAALSQGQWIGVADTSVGNQPLFLEYSVELATSATYEFYARKFWKHGPFRWRFDAGPWQQCGADVQLIDAVPLRPYVVVNWVELGEVALSAGVHRLRIELTASAGPAAFDAFVLSRGQFVPRGRLKPSESYAAAPAGWFTFDPAADAFEASALDLRRLNAAQAGDEGFVQPRGAELVFSRSGRAARFWAVNAGHDVLAATPPAMRRYARFLAKRGVNLVRLIGPFFVEGAFREVSQEKLRQLHVFSAALRAAGIYLALSNYFPVNLPLGTRDGVAGYTGQPPFALCYFNAELKNAQKNWWRALLTTPNPETGLALADDATLAFVELVNEDSTLFWTFKPYETIPEPQTIQLEKRFGAWLTHKYGSVAAALVSWDEGPRRGDIPAEQRAGFVALGSILTNRSARGRDTAEFLTRLMRDYYVELGDTLKQELAFKGSVICSNWHTADDRVLGVLDKWANSVCDVMDRHGYHSGAHSGDAAAYSVRATQKYDDRSALLQGPVAPAPSVLGAPPPRPWTPLPALLAPRYNGKPAVVSELGWPWPNRFRAEAALVTAAYARLHGLDAAIWFQTSVPAWASMLDKFEIAEPVGLGQFPAAAFIFRQGLISEGRPVAELGLSEEQLFALSGGPLAVQPALDTLRLNDVPPRELGVATAPPFVALTPAANLDPLALLVGPVDVAVGGAAKPLQAAALSPWINRADSSVRSNTGELTWDFDIGWVRIAAPAVEGAVGFLAHAGRIELPELSATLRNEYAALVLVALDELPLASSRQLLLQVATESTNSGWLAPGSGLRTLEQAGGPPLLVREVDGRVRLRRADAKNLHVTALDFNGYPRQRARNGADDIVLLPDVAYYLIEP